MKKAVILIPIAIGMTKGAAFFLSVSRSMKAYEWKPLFHSSNALMTFVKGINL
jgi:hypothetical protein